MTKRQVTHEDLQGGGVEIRNMNFEELEARIPPNPKQLSQIGNVQGFL